MTGDLGPVLGKRSGVLVSKEESGPPTASKQAHVKKESQQTDWSKSGREGFPIRQARRLALWPQDISGGALWLALDSHHHSLPSFCPQLP